MATKTGILSDKMYMTNCEEYKPLPIGYANAHFVGNRPNPNLMGIKTPKYQRAAPRPVSADVMAVNMARMSGGPDKFTSARNMLDTYIKEGKSFKPPPVKLKTLEENVEELHKFIFSDRFEGDIGAAQGYTSLSEFLKDYYGLAAGPVPKIILQNRGDAILKQTISTGVNTEDLPDRYFYLARFNSFLRPQKEDTYRRLLRKLREEGVDASLYQVGSQPSVGELESNMNRLLEIVYSRGVVVDLDNIFGVPTTTAVGQQPEPEGIAGLVSSVVRQVSGTFGGTAASEAPTQQGVSMPSSSTTPQEVEKK